MPPRHAMPLSSGLNRAGWLPMARSRTSPGDTATTRASAWAGSAVPGSTARAPDWIWPAKYHPPPAKKTTARATTTASTVHSRRRSHRRGRLVAGAPGGDPGTAGSADPGGCRAPELDITASDPRTRLRPRLRGSREHIRGHRAERGFQPGRPRPPKPVRAYGSGGPLVGADGERREDDEDPDQPHGALPEAVPDRAAERERPHRVHHVGDRLVVGERLQPARHRLDRHERRAEEREREQPDQAERLHRLLIADGQPGERGDAADRHPEHDGQQDHAHGGPEAVLETESDQVPDPE